MDQAGIIDAYVCTPSTVAIVGASPKQERPVYEVMEYLTGQGFRLFPVNPGHSGETIQGLHCLGSLGELPEQVDVVALFVGPGKQEPVVEEMEQLGYKPVVWMQPGAENEALKQRLEAEGCDVVMDACMMMVHQVYCGE
ncbi:MAG: CoA-binding protein [Synergistales bacterium]|nr:CoA-binding protein [Synergistales bacterium]